ncbi:ABC transporter substrate-binding protein [Endozoicomonas sp. SM1973]|uniref:ABC transporter substrate-binding protein n=1 Tax=Spartinivicinus marinus TaxID=2994442 RepID=A0A853II99_9GAMM|nr:ABC transporter substrate-binding protein [Spartinivicinus marinus]MCX4025905.1 ABC transporter substrate-binding protein [Spartinivicinus marinus]NYZ68825.1 ABC transporter substrate-binding protein [Spartinivicinus marinus]
MKFDRCIAVLFAIVALTSNISSAQSIHLVTEPFPPLNMTITDSTYGRNQKVTGFATEIVREVFNRTSSDLEITLYASWDRGFNKALTKQNYGIYSTFRTPERESKFKWVGPLFMEDWIILANPESNIKISKLEDLNKYRVGSFESDPISDYLKDKGVKIETAENDVVNATKLKLKKIDLWATSSLSGPYIAKRHQLNLTNVYTFNSNGLWLAMNKNTDDQTIQQLNASLKQMQNRGEVKKIISQYK